MRLKILGSSSAGNCYLLENDKEALMIECGVRFDKIKQALNFNMRKVSGCLMTHEHQDHCHSLKEVMKAGISVYSGGKTFEALKVSDQHRARPIKPGDEFKVGSFRVLAFDVMHDAAQPLGFMIHHDESGNVLFLTDTYYVKSKFSKLNNIIVEANYSQEILDRKVSEGSTHQFLRDRVFKSHMSIKTCKELLKANDLSDVNNIVLIHLSDGNSNEEQFKNEVAETTGKLVHVARAGMVIENFNKSIF